jgi:hypothetical protein
MDEKKIAKDLKATAGESSPTLVSQRRTREKKASDYGDYG